MQSDPWLWDWEQQETPVMTCQAEGPGHVSTSDFACPLNETAEFADPSQGWFDDGEYHVVVGQGIASANASLGPTSNAGTQALLCSSKGFVDSPWRCDDLLWKFGNNGTDDPIRGVGLYGGMSCPDFWRLHLTEDPLEDLWVFMAAVGPEPAAKDPGVNPLAVEVSSGGDPYWVGRYYSTGNHSAFEKHFVPIDPVPKVRAPYLFALARCSRDLTPAVASSGPGRGACRRPSGTRERSVI